MKRIFKYELIATEKQVLKIPFGSKILSIENQFDNIVLYALVDDESSFTDADIEIIVHGTGHNANDVEGYQFLGTVKMLDGNLMLHMFCERLEV